MRSQSNVCDFMAITVHSKNVLQTRKTRTPYAARSRRSEHPTPSLSPRAPRDPAPHGGGRARAPRGTAADTQTDDASGRRASQSRDARSHIARERLKCPMHVIWIDAR